MNRTRSKDGTQIAFDRVGQGRSAVVLVGGALSDRKAAGTVAAMLAPYYSVFTYDRRGRGDSGDTQPYAVEREIEDIAALIGEAGGSAFAMGGSSGAVLALKAAAAGVGISKLAMYEPPFILDSSRTPLPPTYTADLAEMASAGRRGDAVEYFMIHGVGVPREAVAQMRQSPMWSGLEGMAHTLPYDGMVMGDTMFGGPAALDRWSSMSVPTLVMDGGASPPWLRNAARMLSEVLPNSQYLTLEGQTHAVAPEALVPVLEEFFAGRVPVTEQLRR